MEDARSELYTFPATESRWPCHQASMPTDAASVLLGYREALKPVKLSGLPCVHKKHFVLRDFLVQ
jgi:hypothetical protein